MFVTNFIVISFLLSHVYTGWTIVEISEIKVIVRSLCHWFKWCGMMFVCVQCCISFVLCACWCAERILYVCESADGTPQNPLFLSGSGNSQLQENNPALSLCCDTAHCHWRCAVVCVWCVWCVFVMCTLRSRCTILFWWQYSTADTIWQKKKKKNLLYGWPLEMQRTMYKNNEPILKYGRWYERAD